MTESSLSHFFSSIAQITVVIFGISLFWIIRTVRKVNQDYVAAQAKWWIFPMVDLKASWSFFIWAYKEYAKIKDSKLLVTISAIFFFLTLGSSFGFIASTIIESINFR